jgi:hypothetical protein
MMNKEKDQAGSANSDQKEAELNRTMKADKSLRIGASHGEDTSVDEKLGYARDISSEGETVEEGRNIRTRGSGLTESVRAHPSRSLTSRSVGYGIGGGYERPYKKDKAKPADSNQMYGPIPHAGYYGSGAGASPFERGEAGFTDELSWYRTQYGEQTSGYQKQKK